MSVALQPEDCTPDPALDSRQSGAHTPGPWVTDGISSEGGWEIWTATEPQYSTVICGRNDWPHRAAESHANARLIAASPNLLARLQEQQAFLSDLHAWLHEQWCGMGREMGEGTVSRETAEKRDQVYAEWCRNRAAISKATSNPPRTKRPATPVASQIPAPPTEGEG